MSKSVYYPGMVVGKPTRNKKHHSSEQDDDDWFKTLINRAKKARKEPGLIFKKSRKRLYDSNVEQLMKPFNIKHQTQQNLNNSTSTTSENNMHSSTFAFFDSPVGPVTTTNNNNNNNNNENQEFPLFFPQGLGMVPVPSSASFDESQEFLQLEPTKREADFNFTFDENLPFY